MRSLTHDERCSAALLLGPEEIAPDRFEALLTPAVRRAVRSSSRRGRLHASAQRVLMKIGRTSYFHDSVAPMVRARREALGVHADGPPRVLIRVDEFPRAGGYERPNAVDEMLRFHEIMASHDIPYLIAITPYVARDYLDPRGTDSRPLNDAEVDLVKLLMAEGVTAALHGFDHRTRHAEPRRHSELVGLGDSELDALLERGLGALAEMGVEARTFVPPFNRFAAHQYEILASRFEVIGGGPETVALTGYAATPLCRGGAVYMPAYSPLYGRAAEVERGIRRLVGLQAALWAPTVLHVGWEADEGWTDLKRLVRTLKAHAGAWNDFYGTLEHARALAGVSAAAPVAVPTPCSIRAPAEPDLM